MSDKPTIISFRLHNFERIKVFEMQFDGAGYYEVAGPNANGKSSVLDGVAFAVRGPRGITHVKRPVHGGADEAMAELVTDRFTIHRTLDVDGKHVARLTRPDGKPFEGGAQSFLDTVYNELSFEPMAWFGMRELDQRAMLLRAIGLEAEVAAIEAERDVTFKKRTVVNSEAAKLKARFDAAEPADPFAETEIRTSKELVRELTVASDYLASIESLRNGIKAAEDREQAAVDEVRRLEYALKEARERASGAELEVETARSALAAGELHGPQHRDIELIKADLANLEAANDEARAAAEWHKLRKEWEDKDGEADALTHEIEALDAKQKALVAGAHLPVPGLEIAPERILYNGFPLSQASTAESVEICVGIAMALQPLLSMLIVRKGSDLDENRRKAIEAMAIAHDYTIVAECVQDEPSGDPHEIFLVDGRVTHDGGTAIKKTRKK